MLGYRQTSRLKHFLGKRGVCDATGEDRFMNAECCFYDPPTSGFT